MACPAWCHDHEYPHDPSRHCSVPAWLELPNGDTVLGVRLEASPADTSPRLVVDADILPGGSVGSTKAAVFVENLDRFHREVMRLLTVDLA